MNTTRRPLTKAQHPGRREGSIVVLTALFMSIMLAMMAMAVDVGYIEVTETELRRTVDAGAMAGAGELVNGNGPELFEVVVDVMSQNEVAGREVAAENITIEVGHWDSTNRAFMSEEYQPSAIRLTATQPNTPMFFGRLFGPSQFSITSRAVAVYQPRDIMLVLDYSGSMSFDSRFYAFERSTATRLNESDVKLNMQTIWNQ
ncbi:MAG: pilus assembly protein TadG-related protein, partial [Pirellulales bacterium]|nr:pilus assembly protein TadG-related protein [Pirellulales bacterium]